MTFSAQSSETAPSFTFVPVLGHEIHVTRWGDPEAPLLVMAHGLARTGRDFDELAAGLSDTYHVVCPDMIGRGLSAWANTPSQQYNIANYAKIAAGLIDHFTTGSVAWLGTSMGGQIGMELALGPHSARLSCLLLNDIGPEVPLAAALRILSYADSQPTFATYTEAEIWLRTAYAPFGPASDRFWTRMVRTSLRRMEDGRLALHYDPQIIHQLSNTTPPPDPWGGWRNITTPTHLIYGETSDIVPPDLLEKMTAQGPLLGETCIKACGHAPTLSRPQDIEQVRDILQNLTSPHP